MSRFRFESRKWEFCKKLVPMPYGASWFAAA
jgi:hypothetical protein